uniref:Uncharacterized protein n=1 Tax=Oryza sativa subsp. japonica TaxID=39947 RepID=Q2QMW3_ORYSJ|nr:hypothetical protein LOC_Os12g39810 [Oryza sativa Japonica Group]
MWSHMSPSLFSLSPLSPPYTLPGEKVERRHRGGDGAKRRGGWQWTERWWAAGGGQREEAELSSGGAKWSDSGRWAERQGRRGRIFSGIFRALEIILTN